MVASDQSRESTDGYYQVEVEEQLRTIYTPDVRRAAPKPAPPEPPTGGAASAPPEPLLRVLCGALRRCLSYWFPPDPPQVIAIYRLPERMYCAHCGTDRVARHCPNCGRNVDKQYQKMVARMATYVVAGTEQRRREIAADVQRQLDVYAAELVAQQKQRIAKKLEQLERTYVMQIVRQKRQLDAQLTSGPRPPRRLLGAERADFSSETDDWERDAFDERTR